MPTGYTDTLYRGEPQTFPEFASECARNFGALIELRDSPEAPIPESFGPTPYHRDKLEEAEQDRRRWQEMSDEQVAEDLRRTQAEAAAHRQRIIDTATEREARYRAMLSEVEAWTPPTSEHQGLKDFMIQQLTESISFDCSTTYLPEPPPDDIEAWRRNRLDHAGKGIIFHAKQYAEECERADNRTAWVQALKNSLDSYSA
jgi:hypothetical protein